MNTSAFKRILMFCVALAVGTLGSTGFLVLIPEVSSLSLSLSLSLSWIYLIYIYIYNSLFVEHENYSFQSMHLTGQDGPIPDYQWKMATVIGGAYFVFVAERLLKFFVDRRKVVYVL